MDATRFDDLIKRLATTRLTRLQTLRGLAAGGVAALTGITLGSKEARAKKKNEKKVKVCKCPTADATTCKTAKIKKSKAKKVAKKACNYKGKCQAGVTSCAAGTPGGGTGPGGGTSPGQTCSDGVKNGSETDVDCGGSCPRCADGKACLVANDCLSGTCSGAQCVACTPTLTCGTDANGQCRCDTEFSTQKPVCDKVEALGFTVDDCGKCPPGTETCVTIQGTQFNCYKRCGSP